MNNSKKNESKNVENNVIFSVKVTTNLTLTRKFVVSESCGSTTVIGTLELIKHIPLSCHLFLLIVPKTATNNTTVDFHN